MYDDWTPGAQRALDRAQARARLRGGATVEPLDLLAALVDEPESRAADLLARFGLEPEGFLSALETWSGLDPAGAAPEGGVEPEGVPDPLPPSAGFRAVVVDANTRARALERGIPVGTEHLLAGLIAEARAGRLGGTVVFWHTGGAPALFADAYRGF